MDHDPGISSIYISSRKLEPFYKNNLNQISFYKNTRLNVDGLMYDMKNTINQMRKTC